LGHSMDKIFLDPGIGFGKKLEHNLELLKSSSQLRPYSILWGVSRKSMIGEICNQPDTENRLSGSLAIAAKAFYDGIDIIRVHDVREHVDLFATLEALEG
ncbi:MAG: dihydropteroate synthase, partial [Candidatus Poseidoniales archaeon]